MLFPPYRPFSHSSVFGRDSTLERRLWLTSFAHKRRHYTHTWTVSRHRFRREEDGPDPKGEGRLETRDVPTRGPRRSLPRGATRPGIVQDGGLPRPSWALPPSRFLVCTYGSRNRGRRPTTTTWRARARTETSPRKARQTQRERWERVHQYQGLRPETRRWVTYGNWGGGRHRKGSRVGVWTDSGKRLPWTKDGPGPDTRY